MGRNMNACTSPRATRVMKSIARYEEKVYKTEVTSAGSFSEVSFRAQKYVTRAVAVRQSII